MKGKGKPAKAKTKPKKPAVKSPRPLLGGGAAGKAADKMKKRHERMKKY